MDGVVFSREDELWQRLEDQQRELESLREQKRDKDAAICFLKTKITGLQNKGNAHSGRSQHSQGQPAEEAWQIPAQDDIHAGLLKRERRIEELEQQVRDLQQEMLQRAEQHESEAEALRSALVQQVERTVDAEEVAGQVTAREESDEVLEFRQQVQLRDDQLHSLELAYESLQQHCQQQARSLEEAYEKFKRQKDEELQKSAEQNHRLSISLQRSGREAEEFQHQLTLKENEVARLADSLQEFREREWRVNGNQPHRSKSPTPSAASRSPSKHSPRPPPTPHSPVVSEPPIEDGRRTPERMVLAVEGDSPVSQKSGIGLQERRDTVLQLQEEIHKQIARHRHSFSGQQSPGPPTPQSDRCPWPVPGPVATSPIATHFPNRPTSSTAGSPRPSTSPDDRPLTPARRWQSEGEPVQKADVDTVVKMPAQPSRCLEAALAPALATVAAAVANVAALPLASSARSVPGRASTASRAERQAKPPGATSRSGGAVVSLSVFEQEDTSQKRARQQFAPQQRFARQPQVDQRRRPKAGQPVRPDEAWRSTRTASSASEGNLQRSAHAVTVTTAHAPAQASRGLFRGPERIAVRASLPGSPEATAMAIVAAGSPPRSPMGTAFSPSSPLIGGSVTVPLGGGSRMQASLASARGRQQAASARAPVGGSPPCKAVSEPRGGDSGTEEMPAKVEPAQGDLHQRFASLRDEMKRQRGPAASVVALGEKGGELNPSAVLSDFQQGLYQQLPNGHARTQLLVGSRKALHGSLRVA